MKVLPLDESIDTRAESDHPDRSNASPSQRGMTKFCGYGGGKRIIARSKNDAHDKPVFEFIGSLEYHISGIPDRFGWHQKFK
jgi:hypothetical protein